MEKKTLVIGVIGADVHAVGNKILYHAFTDAGFEVINLGVMVSQEEFIAAAIESKADAIVISCPVYWYTMPACVKAFIDKFYALYIGGHDFKGKKWAVMSCCEASEPETFDGLLFALDKSFELMGAESAGKILLTDVNEAGDIHNTDGLTQAEKLAEHLAEVL